ncbi:MAG: 4'-phosphopantetheinyl transferase family protein [Endozoicomonas sp.]|uniref:4'-phosphopantetheinyl transferase family protein n=1 Tax=Endozoicomonas sp. TaxID=1892382 RepID=UPI003D9B1A20
MRSIFSNELIVCFACLNSLSDHGCRVFLESLLSREELEKIWHFQKSEDQDRYLLAHAVLRICLSKMTGDLSPSQWQFTETLLGKPEIKTHPIHFNLSHAGHCIALCFSLSHECGIDIEPDRQVDDLQLLKQICCLPEELDRIGSNHRHFLQLWTGKEACLKALGTGFSYPPDRLLLAGHSGIFLDRVGTERKQAHFHYSFLEGIHTTVAWIPNDAEPEILIQPLLTFENLLA